MHVSRWLAACATSVAIWAALTHAQTIPAQAKTSFTIDDLVRIKHPSGHQWTPDGKHVWWTYDDGGVNNVWAAAVDGSGRPVQLTKYPDGQTGADGFWSPDGQTFFFQRGGGLQAVSVNGGDPRVAWPSAARASGFTLSPDGKTVVFIVGQAGGPGGGGRGRGGRGAANANPQPPAPPSGADLIAHALAGDKDQSLLHVDFDGRIGGVSWSPDSTRIAYTTITGGIFQLRITSFAAGGADSLVKSEQPISAPSWTPDGANVIYTVGGGGGGPIQHQSSPPEIGPKLIFVATENGRGAPGTSYLVPAVLGSSPKTIHAGGGGGFGGGRGGGGGSWLDSTHQLSASVSNNGKTRTTLSVDINTGETKTLHEETEDKFFSAVNATQSAISPDRKWVLYTADTTGWDQIYVVSSSGGAPVQLTKTPGEHWRAVWSHDSKHIAWDTNTSDKPGTRQIEFATIADDPAKATITIVTAGSGTNTSPQWSPDDKRLLFQHTDAENSADLYVADAAANAKVIRLSSSLPPTIDKSTLVAPQFVHYAGPDGKQVPAWLFVPKNLDRAKKHPAIVWIHPDGVNQNYDGWHTDRNEAVYYEVHQYLLQQGYVVIAPDYRGSIGYGRDWRNDVYMDVGGKDAKDARMAATYLKTLGYVDADRIGVWGLSYGGFFTLLAITQEPTWFRAAIDVAGVADYALYYEDPYHGGWTTSRIGTPEENPEVYAQAAPMSHVDRIQHPLLILHGTADVNVPFIHSVLLMDHLLKAGKADLVQFMVYPGEFHYFDRSFVVRDAWQRVDKFFRDNLHPEK
jgi:dipeptidyl aminopeptidase/acylaminoacyl peptidase